MNINQFIEEYKASANKEKYAEKHITKHYLPFEVKTGLAQKIIDSSMYVELGGKRIFRPNTPSKRFCTTLAIMQNYTDIEMGDPSNKDVPLGQQNLNSFNLLEESGATVAIMKAIGVDVMQFDNIIDMTLQDTLDMERSLVPFLETKVEAMSMAMEVIGQTLKEAQAQAEEKDVNNG